MGRPECQLGVATSAAGLSFRRAAKSEGAKPAVDAARRAGELFKDLRSAAGLNLQELSKAIDLRDQSLLEAVEEGPAGLPFEVILCLASVLGRNDPLTVVTQLTRAYNPKLWKSLDGLGVGKLPVQQGMIARAREHLPSIGRGHQRDAGVRPRVVIRMRHDMPTVGANG